MLTILMLLREYLFPSKQFQDIQTQTESANEVELSASYIDTAYDAYNSHKFKKIFEDL
jgi:hypothetical protein